MNLKTVTAASMPEALAKVKRELGPDAVILHTRTYRRGGLLGLGARTIVEITAGTGQGMPGRRRAKAPAPSAPAAPEPSVDPVSPLAGDLIRRTYAAARAQIQAQQPAAAPVAAAPTPAAAELAEDLRAVKKMVQHMLQQQRNDAVPAHVGGKLAEHYLALLKQEITRELADQVVEQVQATLTPQQLEDPEALRSAMLTAMSRFIPGREGEEPWSPPADGRPRTIALVGPTGVGKTTTIAKLAAIFKLRHKRKLALITLDTYRIAAVEQLRTYANIIGVPLHVANSPQELQDALARCAGVDMVLIDTAGRSQRDDPKLDQLRQFLVAAKPHEVHLVLSSTASQAVMLQTVQRFADLGADRIIFTKLDEAVSFGVLVNVARQVNKRLSYLTTGQEVPHQIEPGQPRRLAELVLGGEV